MASSSNPASEYTADAPGRVNLIGEHTDYNGGFVLPTTIPQRTRVVLRPRSDALVRVWSKGFTTEGTFAEYTFGEETPGRGWLDYVQGVTRILRESGHVLRGFEARIASDVPIGSGLSSSAALEVSLLRALREAFSLELDDIELARIGQRAENELVGARVGILDQMAASLADDTSALFIDTRSLEFRRVPLPPGADLIVLHSGISHNHAAGDYNTRRGECEEACRLLGVELLRDVSVKDLPRIEQLPDPWRRRVRHVVTENDRVLAAVAAIERNDVEELGQLFYASHASMRDDYEVSIPEIDLIVEIASQAPEIYGARLTGGGFGGSVVMLAHREAAAGVASRIQQAYSQHTGRGSSILVPRT